MHSEHVSCKQRVELFAPCQILVGGFDLLRAFLLEDWLAFAQGGRSVRHETFMTHRKWLALLQLLFLFQEFHLFPDVISIDFVGEALSLLGTLFHV